MDCVRRRGRVYNVVVTVPADLIEVVGKRQIWRSLKTKNYDIARSQSRKLLVTMEQLFREVRDSMDSRLINGMVAEFGLDWLEKADRARSFFAGVNNIKTKRIQKAVIYNRQADRTQDQILCGKSNEVLGADLSADEYIDRYGFKDITSSDRTEVVNAFSQAIKLVHKAEAERAVGITETESEFQYRLLEKWNRDKIVPKDVGIPLPDLLTEYGAQWTNDNDHIKSRKLKELGRLEESFRECFSKVLGVKEIDDEKAEEWRDYLQHAYYSDRDLPLTNKAVDNYIKTASAVFNWALGKKGKKTENCSKRPAQTYVERNPFSDGLQLKNYGKANDQSRVFTDDELQTYINVLADNFNPEEPEMVWLPLIMMYSGLRCNEVAQLYLDDLQEREGIPFFRIAPNKERSQSVKTNAEREVPLHHRLKELGFLKYVERLMGTGEIQLFPNCKLQKSGYYYSDAMSTRLNSLINIHVSDERKLRLYSMRKNFRSRLDNIITEHIVASIVRQDTTNLGALQPYFARAINDIMGHAVKGTTGDTVYSVLALRVKATVMELMDHPVDLSSLKKLLT